MLFLSYARADATPLVQRFARDLPNTWLDTLNIGGGEVWSQKIEEVIDNPDTLVVALLSHCSFTSEICRAEHLRALRNGRRLIPVLATSNADRPLYLETRHYRDFSDPTKYDALLPQLIADIESGERATLAAPYGSTRVTYLTAPRRVANYLKPLLSGR